MRCVAMILLAAIVACLASEVPIHEAETVVSFSRGFGADLADITMSREEALASLHQLRHVVHFPSAASFLQLDEFDPSNDVYTLEENEAETKPQPHQSAQQEGDDVYETQSIYESAPSAPEIDGRFHTVAEVADGQSHDEADRTGESHLEEDMRQTDMNYPISAAGGRPDPRKVSLQIGPLHLHVIRALNARNLVRSVQYGASPVPPWHPPTATRKEHEVHQHTVTFRTPFVSRPIVLLTVLPACDGSAVCEPHWPDVFVVSLGHIDNRGFVANIWRMDSTPENSWGQHIKIAYVAFEPNDKRAILYDRLHGNDGPQLTMFTQ